MEKIKSLLFLLIVIIVIFPNSHLEEFTSSLGGINSFVAPLAGATLSFSLLLLINPIKIVLKLIPIVPLVAVFGWVSTDGDNPFESFKVSFYILQAIGLFFCNKERNY